MLYITDGEQQWMIRRTTIDQIFQSGDYTIIRVTDRQDIKILDPTLFKRLLKQFKHTEI